MRPPASRVASAPPAMPPMRMSCLRLRFLLASRYSRWSEVGLGSRLRARSNHTWASLRVLPLSSMLSLRPLSSHALESSSQRM